MFSFSTAFVRSLAENGKVSLHIIKIFNCIIVVWRHVYTVTVEETLLRSQILFRRHDKKFRDRAKNLRWG